MESAIYCKHCGRRWVIEVEVGASLTIGNCDMCGSNDWQSAKPDRLPKERT